MFVVWLFGLLDLFGAVLLILQLFDNAPLRLVVGIALYLGVKAYLYRGDLFSIIDAFVGAYILLGLLFPNIVLHILASMWLGVKGLYSLISVR